VVGRRLSKILSRHNATAPEDLVEQGKRWDDTPPKLEFIFAAHVTVGAPLDFGDVGNGGRRVVPITGGDFSGPSLRGIVLGGGADWQVLRHDGVAELDARYALRTDDDAVIAVRNLGLRHGPAEVMAALAAGQPVEPERYYFRGATCFETSAPGYKWLSGHIVVCTGHREPAAVKLRFYKVC
jgi:Protein of unknown function (DUF3237)